jgi:hypothetical protein
VEDDGVPDQGPCEVLLCALVLRDCKRACDMAHGGVVKPNQHQCNTIKQRVGGQEMSDKGGRTTPADGTSCNAVT